MAAEAEASREARAKVCTLNIVSFSRHSLHGKVHSIQRYVIKFVSDLWQIGGFLWNYGFLHQ
jgi:hypothetical protein